MNWIPIWMHCNFFPDDADMLEMEKSRAFLVKKDIFKNLMWYTLPDSTKHYPLTIERVKKIKDLNRQGIRPADLEPVEVATNKPKDIEPVYADVVGQISLKSLEKTSRKRRDNERGQGGGNRRQTTDDRQQGGGNPQNRGGQQGQNRNNPQQGAGQQNRGQQGGGQQHRGGQNPNQGGGQQRPPQNRGGQQGGGQNPNQQNRPQRPPQNNRGQQGGGQQRPNAKPENGGGEKNN